MVIDEFPRECLAIKVARRLRHDDVLHVLAGLFTRHGPPGYRPTATVTTLPLSAKTPYPETARTLARQLDQ